MKTTVSPLLCVVLAVICPLRSAQGQLLTDEAIDRSSSTSNYLVMKPAVGNSVHLNMSEQVRQSLLQARDNLNPERLPKIDLTRAELEQSLQALEQFVQVGTANGDSWSKFLRLPELHEQLASQKPAYSKLLELEMNMRQNYLGLEFQQFTRVREALGKFVSAARFYTQEEAFLRTLRQSLDETLTELEQEQIDSAKVDLLIGSILNNLHQANQSPQTVQTLYSLYAQPNLRIIINGNLVNRFVSRTVSQPQDVDECILGTRILGQAYLNGDVSANLLPMTNGVALQLNLMACMSSQNRGYNRGVVLNTTSVSPVVASKQVFLTIDGVSSTPAQVATNLQSTINSIEHRLRIVRRIAQKKAAQQKPQADAIAEQRLQSRIGTEFSQQVDQQVAQAQQQLSQFRPQSRPEIKRIGFQRPQIWLSSTSSAVHGSALQASVHQTAAPQSCPFPLPETAAVIGQLHHSAVNNALEGLLGGRVLRSKDLGSYAKQILGTIPDELKKEIEGEDWSITFNPYRPIRLEFVDNVARITLRIVRMTRGDETLNEALSISTAYVPSFDGTRLTLARQGEVLVTSDRETRGVRATALRSFLKSKFDETFRESIVTQPLDLNRFPKLQNLKLNFQQVAIKMDQGWLQVSIP